MTQKGHWQQNHCHKQIKDYTLLKEIILTKMASATQHKENNTVKSIHSVTQLIRQLIICCLTWSKTTILNVNGVIFMHYYLHQWCALSHTQVIFWYTYLWNEKFAPFSKQKIQALPSFIFYHVLLF